MELIQLIVNYGGNTTNSGFGLEYGLGNSYVFGIWNLGCTYDVTIENKSCTESNLG